MKVKMFLRKNASIILLYLIVILLVLPLSVVMVKAVRIAKPTIVFPPYSSKKGIPL